MAKPDFKLEQLFGSKTRARLLGIFMQNSERPFFVRELTRKIDAQLNSVRREIDNLLKLGIIKEAQKAKVKGEKNNKDKKKYYIVNPDFMLFEDLRSLFKKVQILMKQNLVQQIDDKGKIDYLAFTGKFVDEKDVPTDIIIVGGIDQKVLQKLVKAFENEFGAEINYTLMPRDEFLYRRQITDRFLFSILEREKVEMINRVKDQK
jgi:predicted transcriptional regulator